MKIKTERKIQTWPSWDLVYEWEDQFQKELDAPFVYTKRHERYINCIHWNVFSFSYSNDYEFMWNMGVLIKHSRYNRANILPAIIDFHLSQYQLNKFYKAYKKIPFILISSLEVVDFLRENNCPKQIYHFPLSLPDKYKITPTTRFEKEFDLVLMGRTNIVFDGYLKKYVEKHQNFTYVYEQQGNKFHYFTSKGEYIGNINNRKSYIELMRKSKIWLYSTPGIDGGEERTKGFNQVTPKFLELLSCGCHVIVRYKKNSDTDYYQLDKFCSNIETYEQFEKEMDKARSTEVDMKMYSEYLENHYTSKRVELFKTILEKENIAWEKLPS
ncbi:hypothetical protein AGMMS49982_08540 [Bacteroidia bacterium]|nr:hypothetical protein AGMMS49982_08540 [Bacteroidia bacterium]